MFRVVICIHLLFIFICYYFGYVKLQLTWQAIMRCYRMRVNLQIYSYLKVTPGSSFEQTMTGWSPGCYIPSFAEIGLPVPPEKNIFERFLQYMGMVPLEKKFLKGFYMYGDGGHLDHVTSIMSSDFHFLVPESFHT